MLTACRHAVKARPMSALGHKRTYALQKSDVRFAPDSDRESGLAQTVMSALPPRADMCGATSDVRFGPKADMEAWALTCSLTV